MTSNQKCPKLKLNCLLKLLAVSECAVICQKLEVVHFGYAEEIHDPKKIIFPLTCVFTLSCSTTEGDCIPLAIIGNEGAIGVNNLLSKHPMPCVATTIVPGMAMQVDYEMLSKQIGSDSEFTKRLLLYTQYMLLTIAQSSHCNQRHNIVQRVSRVILQLSNTINSDQVQITHVMLGFILGVRREVITNTTIKLRDAGAIFYSRGIISIIDRSILELLSCACEKESRVQFDNLFDTYLNAPNAINCHPINTTS